MTKFQISVDKKSTKIFLIDLTLQLDENISSVYVSYDKGNNWELIFTKNGWITNLSHNNSMILCSTRSDSNSVILEMSKDNGINWDEVIKINGFINSINCLSYNEWLISGNIEGAHKYLRTTDGGINWSQSNSLKIHLIHDETLTINDGKVIGVMRSLFNLNNIDVFSQIAAFLPRNSRDKSE